MHVIVAWVVFLFSCGYITLRIHSDMKYLNWRHSLIFGLCPCGFLLYHNLYVHWKVLSAPLKMAKVLLRPVLAYDAKVPLWLPARRPTKHPLFIYGGPLHFVLAFPAAVVLYLHIVFGRPESPAMFLLLLCRISTACSLNTNTISYPSHT